MLGSTQQVARVLFEQLGLTAGRKGKTGYSTDAKVLRSIRGEHAIVPVIEEWRELSKLLNTYLGPLPALIDETTGPPAHDDQPDRRLDRPALDDEPEPPVDPDPHRPRPRDPLGVHRRGGREAPLGRLLADRAADPRAPLRRAEAEGGVRARRGHPPRDRRRGARQGPGDAHDRRAVDREDDQLRDRLRDLRPTASRRTSRSRASRHRPTSTPTWRASRTCRTSSRGRSSRPTRDGYVTTLLGRRRPGARAPRLEPPDPLSRASGSRSTSRCRARTRTSSRSR